MITIIGERPHVCDECNKSFKDRFLLKRHKRTHEKERPFSCAHCNKVFLSKSELRRHLIVHSGASSKHFYIPTRISRIHYLFIFFQTKNPSPASTVRRHSDAKTIWTGILDIIIPKILAARCVKRRSSKRVRKVARQRVTSSNDRDRNSWKERSRKVLARWRFRVPTLIRLIPGWILWAISRL